MRMKGKTGSRGLLLLNICVLLGFLWGCASVPASGEAVTQNQPVREMQTVMTVDGQTVTAEEARVYLYLMQKPYETCYGTGIWQEQREEGETWEAWLLEEVKHQITELTILSIRAEQGGLTLTDDERTALENDADAAYDGMGEAADRYGITRDTVRKAYEKSLLAGAYYQSVTDSYSAELSEDEWSRCRAMTVQQMFIAEDDNVHLKDGQTQEQLAEQLRKRASEGEDFETLAKAYSSENAQWLLSFDDEGYVFDTDGWLEEEFVKAAWELEEGGISPVIHTSYGYHVLKCAAVDSDELKQQAADRILNEKKKKKFDDDYEKWLQEIICTEEAAWQEIHVLEGI